MTCEMKAIGAEAGQRTGLQAGEMGGNVGIDGPVTDQGDRRAVQADFFTDGFVRHLDGCLKDGDGQRFALGVAAVGGHGLRGSGVVGVGRSRARRP